MIMALIYRNVPRKKASELLLLGERIDAHEAERLGIVNRVVADAEFDAAVDDWAARLASKSPALMKLGKDAMWRQQDLALMDALDFLRSLPDARLLDRGHPGGRDRVLREAGAGVEGSLSPSVVALLCRTSDREGFRADGAQAVAEAIAAAARHRGAADRLARRAAREHLRGGPARLARVPARGRRAALGRLRRRAPADHLRRGVLDLRDDAARAGARPARRVRALARRPRRLQLARARRPRSSSAACAWPARAASGTRASTVPTSTRRAS